MVLKHRELIKEAFIVITFCHISNSITGRWQKCVDNPPVDVLLTSTLRFPAWSPSLYRLGRGEPLWMKKGCYGYFPKGSEVSSKDIYVLRYAEAVQVSGWKYEWIPHHKYFDAKRRPFYTAVRYEEKAPYLVCNVKDAYVKTCDGKWHHRELLGLCNDFGDHWAYVTLCNREFIVNTPSALTDTFVLVVTKVSAISMDIDQIDPIVHSRRTVKVLRTEFETPRGSPGESFDFREKYPRRTVSKFNIRKTGWQKSIKYTYKTQFLDAHLKGYLLKNNITLPPVNTDDEVDKTDDVLYSRQFVSDTNTRTVVEVPIYEDTFHISFYGMLTPYSAFGDVMYDNADVQGTWTGVVTTVGEEVVIVSEL